MSYLKRLINSLLILAPLILAWACSGQNGRQGTGLGNPDNISQDPSLQAVITFDTLKHDFGTIIEGEKVVCYFDYYNRGENDLVIRSVEATCGCTIPEWSREPLKPGDKRYLKIVFDAAGRSGVQRKVVTVMSNATNSVVRLTLTANVIDNV
jgi:hypothetical protein